MKKIDIIEEKKEIELANKQILELNHKYKGIDLPVIESKIDFSLLENFDVLWNKKRNKLLLVNDNFDELRNEIEKKELNDWVLINKKNKNNLVELSKIISFNSEISPNYYKKLNTLNDGIETIFYNLTSEITTYNLQQLESKFNGAEIDLYKRINSILNILYVYRYMQINKVNFVKNNTPKGMEVFTEIINYFSEIQNFQNVELILQNIVNFHGAKKFVEICKQHETELNQIWILYLKKEKLITEFNKEWSYLKYLWKFNVIEVDKSLNSRFKITFEIIENSTLDIDYSNIHELIRESKLLSGNFFSGVEGIISKYEDEDSITDLSEFILYKTNLEMKKDKVYEKLDCTQLQEYIDKIPFELSKDQMKTITKIRNKWEKGKIVNALIQGDVGSGKTILMILSMILMLLNKRKVLVIVPRVDLKNQHIKEVKKYMDIFGLNYQVGSDNSADIIFSGIGAVKSKYEDIGLILVDEPHLISFNDKNTLNTNYVDTNIIYTTATPQPKENVLTLIGNLELYKINTLPNGRIPVKTLMFKKSEFSIVENRINEALRNKEFTFVVFNSVNGEKNIYTLKEQYEEKFPNAIIELAHGQQDNREVFERAKRKEIDILISTNVIQVGINIPHATNIVIYDTGWIGVSEFHQLRGRVGRNSLQSYCFIEQREDEEIKEYSPKWTILNSNNNVKISEDDLLNRGIDSIIGEKQSGSRRGKIDENKNKIDTYIKIAKEIEKVSGRLNGK